jgi:hypothetical protein
MLHRLLEHTVTTGPITEAGVADGYFKAPWAGDEVSWL